MTRLGIATIHPSFIDSYTKFGVLKRAIASGSLDLTTINLRDFAVDHHGSVDDKPYGGGDGMVIRAEPLYEAMTSFDPNAHVVFTSPKAKPFRHEDALRLSKLDQPIFMVCGRFGGIDQRFIDLHVDEEFSMGDFVLSGGELAVLSIVDAIVRLLPGSLGNEDSAKFDSFAEGLDGALEYPLYTRPAEFQGIEVPKVLLSGDHHAIAEWRKARTQLKK